MQKSSFFDGIKSQVPSLDSDLASSSDSEEEVSLYQRPSAFKMHERVEFDLIYPSLEEPEIEDLLKSFSEPFMSDDVLSDQRVDPSPLFPEDLDENKTQVAKMHDCEIPAFNLTQPENLRSEFMNHSNLSDKNDVEHEQKKTNGNMKTAEEQNKSPKFPNPKNEHLLQRSAEVCVPKLIEGEGESNTLQYPVLSLKSLENWDLNEVLQSLKQHTGHHKDTRKRDTPLRIQPLKYPVYGNDKSKADIMDQLAAFCKMQASKMVTVSTCLTEKSHTEVQSPCVKNPSPERKADASTKYCNVIAEKLQLKDDSSPTVNINLCIADHPTKPAVILNTSSCFDQLKQSMTRDRVGNSQPEVVRWNGILTGKNSLLQKIRESRQIRTENSVKSFEDCSEPKKEETLGLKRHQHSCRNSSPAVHVDETYFPTTACDESAEPADKTLSCHKKEESDHVQKEQQMNKAQRQQYMKQLLTFNPQRSTHDKQSAAEMTDALYDTDGSHTPSVSTLSPLLQGCKCLLLTVTMSSPGVVAGGAQGKAHTVESTIARSHIFNSLIAWFLSLAEPKSSSTKDTRRNGGNTAPFWVAGLQQVWSDDGLVLYACAVCPVERTPSCIKSRERYVKKDWALFRKRVSKFLSQTQLRTVVPWLSELNHLLQHQANPELVSLPSSSLDCFVSINSDKQAVKKAFGMSPGFFWQTLETQDQICQKAGATTFLSHTEVVFALGCQQLFLNPLATHHTLQLLLSSGLDVCGLRLTYPSEEVIVYNAVNVMSGHGWENSHQPILALAIRGPYASSVWQKITGPSDPQQAQKTDPESINALYCYSQDQHLPLFQRLTSQMHLGLCVWFGGRVSMNHLVTKQKPGFSGKGDGTLQMPSAATLCATMKGDVFLLVSPVVVPCCYSYVMSACAKKGFQLLGVQRIQISSKQDSFLGLTSEQMSAFCHTPTVFVDRGQLELYSHCLVLLLRRENALRHSANLSTGLMNELAVQGLIGVIRARLADDAQLMPDLCFHAVPYTESLFSFLGGLMWTLPDFSHVILSNHKYPSCSEIEQIVILTLTGNNIMEEGISLLHKVIRGDVTGVGEERFELLALKWLPTLSQRQAQELSPFEVGDRLWKSSVASLASSPALVCALRRLEAFKTLQRLLPQNYPGNLSVLMSPTPQTTFRQASLFFTEAEFIPDHSSRTVLKYLPPQNIGFNCQSFYSCMTADPQPLLTMALFKPGVWRHCLGKILSNIQKNCFIVVGLRVLVLDSKMAHSLMDAQGPSEKVEEVKYLTSGPVLALCLQRVNAVKRLLELLGPEDPAQACAEEQHLWRASYGTDRLHNGLYGSLSYQKAILDVKMMFSDGLCCTQTSVMKYEQIQCLTSDPVASLERQQCHAIAKNKLSESLIEEPGCIRAGCSVRSALCQTTCLLMPSSVLKLSRPPLHLDLLEKLLSTGCHLVAGRLSALDKGQRRHISELLRPPAGRAVNGTLLCEGPCLILALQKDNIVTCFELILESICRDRPDFEKVRNMLLYPSLECEAVRLLCYLFDGFSPDSRHVIVPK
ncbi:dynein axonemal assembly factor 8 isoform X2 [Hoplias malabaricus]|uniref:dynein axonemal assembly factor 8 isoform X2 n=1 Tax=Hoplias malabaricus TaxID=27720 RepID=UPI00346370A5